MDNQQRSLGLVAKERSTTIWKQSTPKWVEAVGNVFMKQCTACKESKELSEFRLVKRKGRADEIYCKCRPCEKTYYRERRRQRAEEETNRTKVWRDNNRDKARAASNTWKANNKAACRRLDSERRAREKSATVLWYEKEKVNELYAEARRLGKHVDHIVPLTHNLVCGLHCLDNLQLLDPIDNLKKKNTFMI